ncbi:hypothetical protein ACO0QE_003195 [Hanseniaspora vineae]
MESDKPHLKQLFNLNTEMLIIRRAYSTGKLRSSLLSSKSKGLLKKKPVQNLHPQTPARTRFAPSPTGFLHMGSLRTALYNYLLAKNTGGQFLLRLEDTDQKRLIPGAEQNIYDSLKWLNIEYDEGPGKNDKTNMGPYRQSDRSETYSKHVQTLLDNGHAYRCFCSKERLDGLRDSAQKLQPPTTVSYDRHCLKLSEKEIKEKLDNFESFTVRLKSPDQYPEFEDILHGKLNIQPQINFNDVRYDDPILMKSDGLPTYHLANVVDDHIMKITHVIRGEEWLPSTPKHRALYNAFGWKSPKFVHIPLLTSANDKKLSKRKNDASVLAMKEKGVLPEALLNFSALFGWSPPRHISAKTHDCYSLEDLIKLFDLNTLTKGNAKVDEQKLWFLNKYHLQKRLEDPTKFNECVDDIYGLMGEKYTKENIAKVLKKVGPSLTTLKEFPVSYNYFFEKPDYKTCDALHFKETHEVRDIKRVLTNLDDITPENASQLIETLTYTLGVPKKLIFESLRYALAGSHSGVRLSVLLELLGPEETKLRLAEGLASLLKR